MKKRIIVDFDNTMGVPGCDVDDGLALLYLLGCDDAEIIGICTTYGNNTLETVHENTRHTLDLFEVNTPLKRGLPTPLSAVDEMVSATISLPDKDVTTSKRATDTVVADARTARHMLVTPEDAASAEAPRFIADALTAAPGQLHILSTGSTTNLGAVSFIWADALAKADSITLMGGITRSLVINGRIMNELNLSCDPVATCAVLASGTTINIATAQNCLPAFFTRENLLDAFGDQSWIYQTCDYWFRTMNDAYQWHGWTCWDVVAAAYLMHPELFCDQPVDVTVDERLLSVGYLELDNPAAPHAQVNLPTIRNAEAFKTHILETWARALQRINLD